MQAGLNLGVNKITELKQNGFFCFLHSIGRGVEPDHQSAKMLQQKS